MIDLEQQIPVYPRSDDSDREVEHWRFERFEILPASTGKYMIAMMIAAILVALLCALLV
jgi:ABC-type multidrug transport system permease subunit